MEEIGGDQKHFKAEQDLWQHGPIFCKMNVIVLVQDHKNATSLQMSSVLTRQIAG